MVDNKNSFELFSSARLCCDRQKGIQRRDAKGVNADVDRFRITSIRAWRSTIFFGPGNRYHSRTQSKRSKSRWRLSYFHSYALPQSLSPTTSRPSMVKNTKTPEEYVSDALALMVKAGWVKQHGHSVEGPGVDWTDRGKLCRERFDDDFTASKSVHPRTNKKMKHPHFRIAAIRSALVRRA